MADLSEREQPAARTEKTERDRARARVERKHKLRADFGAYVVVSVALTIAWALTGFGSFWPGWVIGIWGVFLLLDALNVYFRRPVTEEEIDEELRRKRA